MTTGPSHISPAADVDKRPESLRYLLGAWAVMVFTELAHQVLNAIAHVADPSALKQAAREAARARGQEVSDDLISLSAYTSIAMMTLVQVGIIALLAVALRAVSQRKKWATGARQLLTVFSVFFAIRLVVVMLAPSAASAQLPIALASVLGVAQIVVGVAAACGLVYASRQDVKEWLPGHGNKRGKDNG